MAEPKLAWSVHDTEGCLAAGHEDTLDECFASMKEDMKAWTDKWSGLESEGIEYPVEIHISVR